MKKFGDFDVHSNPSGFGPLAEASSFVDGIPFSPFCMRTDKVGKIGPIDRAERKYFIQTNTTISSFDCSKCVSSDFLSDAPIRARYRTRLQIVQKQSQRREQMWRREKEREREERSAQMNRQNPKKQLPQRRKRRFFWKPQDERNSRAVHPASVVIKPEWTPIHWDKFNACSKSVLTVKRPYFKDADESSLGTVTSAKKGGVEATDRPKDMFDGAKTKYSTADDIKRIGKVKSYKKRLVEKISPKNPFTLEDISAAQHDAFVSSHATATNDPEMVAIIEKAEPGSVFMTDDVFSMLVLAHRSEYAWDIVVKQFPDNKLVFDKRDKFNKPVEKTLGAPVPPQSYRYSDFDLFTHSCYENVSTVTFCDERQRGFTPRDFAKECLEVNNSFIHYCSGNKRAGHVYKRYVLPGTSRILYVRGSIDSVIRKDGNETLLRVIALLETDFSKQSSSAGWRHKLKDNVGSTLFEAAKTDGCKINRHIVSAAVSGCKEIKIAWVSRTLPTDSKEHSVLRVSSYKVGQLMTQLSLKEEMIWKHVNFWIKLADTCMKKPESSVPLEGAEKSFVIIRDRLMPQFGVFKTDLVFPGGLDDGPEKAE
ncbi:Eukaryotic translation initiation factor 3 subunit D like protein [Aduncisulcus paluster]|uniref:Eukaryotic translation initiation factor 3 subunit D like protein n=1 Tax=Aduncisulcus paluster TaxID=2918883 RepID=A0ABQ5K674_9EUKA|nr:Eukaryotic translation initiation factor 3 subunit D like protein [Aduncisulcus paluster]